MSTIIVVTSGKGGVGKTTTSASVAMGLALRGKKTCVIDFDVGLRNLDLIMGMENRIVFDMIEVIQGHARLNQALIRDKNSPNLFLLASSQTKEKDHLTKEGIRKIFDELDEMGFEFIICDSPAGVEHGAIMAFYYADKAIVTVNPDVSSIKDADRMVGVINGKSWRAENNLEEVKKYLVITRYNPERVEEGEMMSIEYILETISLPLYGLIPEDNEVLLASNTGKPVILNDKSRAGLAYSDFIERLLGHEDLPFRFTEKEKFGFIKKVFGKR